LTYASTSTDVDARIFRAIAPAATRPIVSRAEARQLRLGATRRAAEAGVFGRATIAGSGEEIVEYLHDIREQANFDVEFAARSYFPTLSYEAQVELMDQLATEVSPHV